MAKSSALPEDEISRRASAIKALSLGIFGAAAVGVILTIIFWLVVPSYPVIPITTVALAMMLISSSAYRLAKAGRARLAGYIFVVGSLIVAAVISPLFGGFIGPMTIVYLFPILVAGTVLGIGYSFLIATLATVFYLAMIPVEQAGLLPQLVVQEEEAAVISYLAVGSRIVFFYLVAFLSWFAASRLHRALQNVRTYAAELQTANEKLQSSEEELRAANEELRATEEALQESEERYRSLVEAGEHMREGIFLLQDTDKVKAAHLFANEEWSRITGYSIKELRGISYYDVIHPRHRAAVADRVRWRLQQGQDIPGRWEISVITKDGTEVPLEVSGGGPITYHGKLATVGYARDITERKLAEEALRASNEELQATNEELREAQEQLIRSERLAAIGQLAGGVGHELRNPLGAIKNATYYIKGKLAKSELAEKEPRVLEFLDIVDDEINTSNKIINDLLGFSRVGKPAVTPTLVKKIVEEALARAPVPENIELTENLDSDSTEIAVDAGQIQQVLINVITNAVQAMPKGGKLTISTREKRGFLELDVTDTGSGITNETKGKIFDPLFTTKAKGIGLGLAVSKSIIDRHGGQIEAKSTAGKGTTFTIRLPLKTPVQEDSVEKK
ncbi:MAG: ATP-binding protein [Chloroflexota bacterium]